MFQVLSYFQAARFETQTDAHLVTIIKAQEDDVRRAESLYRGALDDIQVVTQHLEAQEAANDMASNVCDDLMDENRLLRGKVISLKGGDAAKRQVVRAARHLRTLARALNQKASVLKPGDLATPGVLAEVMRDVTKINEAAQEVEIPESVVLNT